MSFSNASCNTFPDLICWGPIPPPGDPLIYMFLLQDNSLQCYVRFCCTTMWISNNFYKYICVYICIHSTSWTPSHPSKSSQRARLGSLCYIAICSTRDGAYMSVPLFQLVLASPSLPGSTSPFSIWISIPSLQIGSSILSSSRFHIYTLIYMFYICVSLCDLLHSITGSRFIYFTHRNWLKFIPFYGWIIFHYTYVPHILYPSSHLLMEPKLLPCPSYYK